MKRIALATGLTAALLAVPTVHAGTAGLYERLGARPGVEAIASTLIERAATDPLLGPQFAGSNLARIKAHLADELCEVSGGPCHYDDDPLRVVHAGHDISEAQFYHMVDALSAILRERGIVLADRNRLLAQLAPLKRDIVRVPPGAE